jgi:hypothetical protein
VVRIILGLNDIVSPAPIDPMLKARTERYRHPGLPPAMPRPLNMVQEYTEGTLILDVLDAATKSLVWRGTAQAEVLPSVDVPTREACIRGSSSGSRRKPTRG